MALVTLRAFRDPVDAGIAKARLDLADIPSVLMDEHLIGVQWLYSNALGGVKLAVDEADLEAARRVLAQDEEVAARQQEDLCPHCGADRIHPSRVRRNAAALSLLTSLPVIAWRRRWICEACGSSWRPHEPAADTPEETLAAERLVQVRHAYPGVRGFLATLLGLAILWYVQYRLRNP